MSQRDQTANEYWLSPEFFSDPYPSFDTLRATDPVHWNEVLKNWVFTRYDHVVAVLRNTRVFSNQGRMAALLDELPETERPNFKPLYNHFSVGLIHADPPDHTRLRRLLNKVFTAEVVERLRPRVQTIVDELVDTVQPRGEADLIQNFAFPLPATVICELLGVPVKARDQVKQWSENHLKILSATCPIAQSAGSIQTGVLEMREYFRQLIEERRRQPREDVLSFMVLAEEEGHKLSLEELLTTAVTILVAGHETTTNLIGNGLVTLLRHADQLQRLRESPELMPLAIEEILRYESPIQRNIRTVKEDVEIAGKQIRRGQSISAMLGAANRDPAVFAAPDAFDITRQDNRHVAFGFGIHACIGAPLARLEGSIAIGTILRRFPKLRLATEQVEWKSHSSFRTLKALPVSF